MENGMPYYRAKVYRFILQFVKNYSLAEDLTQDVMLKVWSKYERLSTLDDMDNYVLKMAKNHIIDHFKKLAREKAESHVGVLVVEKFLNAHARGKVLCRDGKERTHEDWLRGLPEATASQLNDVLGHKS